MALLALCNVGLETSRGLLQQRFVSRVVSKLIPMPVVFSLSHPWRFAGIFLAWIALWPAPLRAEITLLTARTSPYDLQISAGLAGVPVGESRYVTWADIATLPTATLEVEDEFVPGRQTVTVIMLADLWDALPVAADHDTVVAYCTDGYFSIYQPEFLAAQKPFVVIKINDLTPESWPPEGLTFNPGPYVISMSDELAPGSSQILDVGHKRPWGVDEIQFHSLTDVMAPAHAGDWAALSPRGEMGRELWINSCASCHPGPGGLAGGDKSQRPFEVLAAHAKYNDAYFRNYVRDPRSQVASATMEAHPHYNKTEMDALIAFIVAEPAGS